MFKNTINPNTYVNKRMGRKPIVGTLQAKQILTVGVSPAIKAIEVPIILTPNANDIVFQHSSAEYIVLGNRTDKSVYYALVILPKAVANAATIPWKQVLNELGSAVNSNNLLKKIYHILNIGKTVKDKL